MIASVRGTVLALKLDGVVVEVGGVGMLVHATPSTLVELRHGQEAVLHTTLVVREDSLTLFGFAAAEGRDAFDILLTVSGIGPRLALAMLAVHDPEELRRAVAAEDLAALMKVPGIGRKGAQRIVLEVGDRLGAPSGPLGALATPAAAPAAVVGTRKAPPSPVVDALVGLGWSAKQAEDAVTAVTGDPEVSETDLAGVLRAALRHLGRR